MTRPELYAWILLATPRSGATLRELIAAADAINRAIPTPAELQDGLGGLLGRRLVREEPGRRFALTDLGVELRARAERKGRSTEKQWSALAAALEPSGGATEPRADLTAEELEQAYRAYEGR